MLKSKRSLLVFRQMLNNNRLQGLHQSLFYNCFRIDLVLGPQGHWQSLRGNWMAWEAPSCLFPGWMQGHPELHKSHVPLFCSPGVFANKLRDIVQGSQEGLR